MKIYTKTGDQGETGLISGERVPKDHLRLRCYGAVDELNANLGLVLATLEDEFLKNALSRIQGELFQIGAELATPRGSKTPSSLVGEENLKHLEDEIDQMEKELSPLKNFILPGGMPVAATLHLARTVSRRTERELITLHRAEPVRQELLQYLNRLSDYFFVASRRVNHIAGVEETPWSSKS